MNEVLDNLKAGVDLLDGYHTAVLILPNHVDERGRYIICTVSRDDEGYWKGDGTNPFDLGYMPKTFGRNLKTARELVQEENESRGIYNKNIFKEFISLNSDIKSFHLDRIVNFNYGGEDE
tara:strand:+ start:55 stop:414 length:360 start_codon:yes stop_codon:yes gene_type:complete